jgi:type IV pilus assembly protein PilM
MVNIGLALRGLLPKGEGDHYSIIDIDAMPGVYKPPAINLVRVMAPVLVVLAIVGIGWGGIIVKGEYDDTADLSNEITVKELQLEQRDNEVKSLRASEEVLQSQLASLEATNAALSDEIKDWEELVALQEELNLEPIEDAIKASSMEGMFASLTQGLDEIDDYLAEVVTLASDNINLLSVQYGEGMVNIRGVALTEGDIFTYAKALRNSIYFDNVVISTISGTARTEAGEEITVYEFFFFVS